MPAPVTVVLRRRSQAFAVCSIRWVLPSIWQCRPHSPPPPPPLPPVCRPVHIIFTVYSLLIGIVSLGARLGVTYVAGTAVEHGQEMLMSFSLTMMHPCSRFACSKRNRFESIKGWKVFKSLFSQSGLSVMDGCDTRVSAKAAEVQIALKICVCTVRLSTFHHFWFATGESESEFNSFWINSSGLPCYCDIRFHTFGSEYLIAQIDTRDFFSSLFKSVQFFLSGAFSFEMTQIHIFIPNWWY